MKNSMHRGCVIFATVHPAEAVKRLFNRNHMRQLFAKFSSVFLS